MQASRRIVGDEGFVLGVDVKPIEPIDLPNVRTLIGNITDPHTMDHIKEILPGSADVVVSDVAPNVSGIWELDHARQIDLARRALEISTFILKPKGNFFVKAFQGSMLRDYVGEIKQRFLYVKMIKPRASRAKSAEVYVLGMNRRHVK